MAELDKQSELRRRLLESQRQAFQNAEWDETAALHKELEKLGKLPVAIRVEAACLAARALATVKDRAKARAVLQTVARREYRKAVHYEFLVRAFLDLKNYDEAARCAGLAAKVQKAERAAAQPSDADKRSMPGALREASLG